MDELARLMTDRVLELRSHVDGLRPGNPIQFETIPAEARNRQSSGMYSFGNAGREVIRLDPDSATEHTVAHELMHALLARLGWPRVFAMLEGDTLALRLSTFIASICDHYVFMSIPEYIDRGFYPDEGMESVVPNLHGPEIDPRQDWSSFLDVAMTVLTWLLVPSTHRAPIIQALKTQQPKALALATGWASIVTKSHKRTKRTLRQTALRLIDAVDSWIIRQAGASHLLRERIGISPLFDDRQLAQPASRTIDFISGLVKLDDMPIWTIGLQLKSDGSRFCTFTIPGKSVEPPDVRQVIPQWERTGLHRLLDGLEAQGRGVSWSKANGE